MKLLLTGAFDYSEEQLNRLRSVGYEITFVQDERVPLKFDVSDIDGVICNSLFLHNDISKFKNLKFIQLTSVGLDRVPLEYIKEYKISLFNAKGVYSIPMAEWVVLKLLEIYKKSKNFHTKQLTHTWEKQRDLLELTGKTAAIIGFGNVGQEVAKRLKVFEVHTIGVGKRQRDSNLLDEYYTISDIDKVFKKSDIIILTLPLTEETRYLIDRYMISFMKRNAVLINVSRGGVIDEAALIEALDKEMFLGVALDVFEEEPLLGDSSLWGFDRVLITPHNSFVSDKVNERLFELILGNVSYCFKKFSNLGGHDNKE